MRLAHCQIGEDHEVVAGSKPVQMRTQIAAERGIAANGLLEYGSIARVGEQRETRLPVY